MTGFTGRQPARLFAVDRIEGAVAVLIGDDAAVVEVPRTQLPPGATEGSVLRVPAGTGGVPDWAAATLDEAERQRRLEAARRRLERLARRDPGGNITL